jgi:hypothetical protein
MNYFERLGAVLEAALDTGIALTHAFVMEAHDLAVNHAAELVIEMTQPLTPSMQTELCEIFVDYLSEDPLSKQDYTGRYNSVSPPPLSGLQHHITSYTGISNAGFMPPQLLAKIAAVTTPGDQEVDTTPSRFLGAPEQPSDCILGPAGAVPDAPAAVPVVAEVLPAKCSSGVELEVSRSTTSIPTRAGAPKAEETNGDHRRNTGPLVMSLKQLAFTGGAIRARIH